MIRAILICPNPMLRAEFEAIAEASADLQICKTMPEYPQREVLKRQMRVWAPDVVFMSIEELDVAEELSRFLGEEFSTTHRVALAPEEQPALLRAALRMKMAELLVPPIDQSPLFRILTEIKKQLELNPASVGSQNHFCAFLPAKGGVGASTVSANVASAFAATPEANVLLADFDVYSGVTGFLFDVEHDFSMYDAAVKGKALDEETWKRLIRKAGNLDLLLSSGPTAALDHPLRDAHLAPILDFAHRNYSVVCADLADSFDDRSLAVLRESSKIFVVATPDLAALRMARLKAMALQKLDWMDKAFLVVNRVSRGMELSLPEIEKTVGLPLFASFPSEYADVSRAARTGSMAPKLSSAAQEFASKVLKKKFEAKRARFIERFAVVPARYAFK